MFIPNTYEFYWTTTADQFLERMWMEYKRFWNEDRRTKATALGLTPEEVMTVASIVQEESNKKDEKPIIAGFIPEPDTAGNAFTGRSYGQVRLR